MTEGTKDGTRTKTIEGTMGGTTDEMRASRTRHMDHKRDEEWNEDEWDKDDNGQG